MKEEGTCGKVDVPGCCMMEEGTCVVCEKLDPSGCCWYDDGICPNGLIKAGFSYGSIG